MLPPKLNQPKPRTANPDIIHQSRIRSLKGYCAEKWVQYKLRDQGWTVVKLYSDYNDKTGDKGHQRQFNKQWIVQALKDKNVNTAKADRILRVIEDYAAGIPDFLCLKDNQLKFVEVKAVKPGFFTPKKKVYPKLTAAQHRAMQGLKREGFQAEISYVEIGLALNDGIKKYGSSEEALSKFF